MWGAGSAMYTIVVITVTLQLAVTINYWTPIHHVIFWASVALKYAFILVMAVLRPSFATSAHSLFTTMIAGTPTYWLLVGVVPVICLLPDFTMRAYTRIMSPEDHEVVQEAALLYGHNPPPKPAFSQQAPAGASEEPAPLAAVRKNSLAIAQSLPAAAKAESTYARTSRKLATADYA